MSNKLQLRVFICALVFFVASMSAMLVYAQNKAVIIDEVEGQPGMEENVPSSEKIIIKNLNIRKDSDEGNFIIPLPQGVSAEQVSIENKYILQELWVSITDCESSFLEQQWIVGDTRSILSGTYEVREDRVVLKLLLDDIYECKNVLENGKLIVQPLDPHSQYDKIVVIDPLDGSQQWGTGNGSVSENKVVLDVAKKLQVRFASPDVKVYFTRLDNAERSIQLREHFVEMLEPDFVICLGTNASQEAFGDEYGIEALYNAYFTPGISGLELADTLVKEVATSTVGRGNGIWEETDFGELFLEIKAPAVLLRVGYLSNEKERELLAKEKYRDRIAEGIYNAIQKMFEGEMMHEQ